MAENNGDRSGLALDRVRRASFDWDSVGFFEGAEKLLEIWFELPCDETGARKGKSLRSISRENWETVLEHVSCKIINIKSNNVTDAYLLSESSMFIAEDRFILKTCGVTTLLAAVPSLISLVQRECNVVNVRDIFYSRKNFEKPELQTQMHRRFDDEVAYLDKIFSNGAAYCMGRMNGDRWYLYMLDQPLPRIVPDQTLEIYMDNLDTETMTIFTKKHSATAEDATRVSGIKDLFPGAIIDDALFEPVGYSMNGLLGDCYFTIHITPQPECSYASFETNLPQDSYSDLVSRVIELFKPGKFSFSLFANQSSSCGASLHAVDERHVSGYRRCDKQYSEFPNQYNLTFCHYIKLDSPRKPSGLLPECKINGSSHLAALLQS
eukprot:scpid72574/ scgid18846/ S-adenosylmethionine decarboxylase proenzyme; S-adenosylmethionine decarboxylase alpha chain; S-adenosylmethionine decarboxylase beta chain